MAQRQVDGPQVNERQAGFIVVAQLLAESQPLLPPAQRLGQVAGVAGQDAQPVQSGGDLVPLIAPPLLRQRLQVTGAGLVVFPPAAMNLPQVVEGVGLAGRPVESAGQVQRPPGGGFGPVQLAQQAVMIGDIVQQTGLTVVIAKGVQQVQGGMPGIQRALEIAHAGAHPPLQGEEARPPQQIAALFGQRDGLGQPVQRLLHPTAPHIEAAGDLAQEHGPLGVAGGIIQRPAVKILRRAEIPPVLGEAAQTVVQVVQAGPVLPGLEQRFGLAVQPPGAVPLTPQGSQFPPAEEDPGVGLGEGGRKAAQPAFQQAVAAGGKELLLQGVDQVGGGVPILRRQEMGDGLFVILPLQVPGGGPAMEPPDGCAAFHLLQTALQKLAKEGVVAVGAAGGIEGRKEQPALLQGGQHRRRIVPLQQGVAQGRFQPVQDGGAAQKSPPLLRLTGQDHAGQIVVQLTGCTPKAA